MKIGHKRVSEEIDVVDASGGEHKVLVFTIFIETPKRAPHRGREQHLLETVRMELDDKRPVNRLDADTFQVVITGEILKRVS